MAKARTTLVVLLPPYPEKAVGKAGLAPGMTWRRKVHAAIKQAAELSKVDTYPAGTEIECTVRLALQRPRLNVQDVDNLLKHVFDALQGRLGGSKSRAPRWQLVPNDYQIRKVVVEKVPAPQRKYGSRLAVRKYTRGRRSKTRPS